jgi:hypothetical protein
MESDISRDFIHLSQVLCDQDATIYHLVVIFENCLNDNTYKIGAEANIIALVTTEESIKNGLKIILESDEYGLQLIKPIVQEFIKKIENKNNKIIKQFL